ncbi:hypothetical protein BCR44DRAFT_1436815, partial [Catenaria anguillulae PL171]
MPMPPFYFHLLLGFPDLDLPLLQPIPHRIQRCLHLHKPPSCARLSFTLSLTIAALSTSQSALIFSFSIRPCSVTAATRASHSTCIACTFLWPPHALAAPELDGIDL